ncbi:hypothetical protein [Mucilaginibacter sp.]|uniref:hypothetical protein n=1 Tax=Mucilaginibacter sp. TaxID=1882438 RepID=UPI00262510F5|nr:hypothetical protein [Mucilaginibacter sp.]MDB4922697.1 putative transrane protein [Mucilaginibacter sp.]
MEKIMWFLSLLFAGLTLAPAMAHLLEMPQKMELSMENYKVVQAIYRGWSLLGVLQIGAIVFTFILLFYVRQKLIVFRLTLAAFLCLAITIVIFFIFTYPANAATSNWTISPKNWVALRQQWEYSHTGNAVLELISFILLILGVLNKEDEPLPPGSSLLGARIY